MGNIKIIFCIGFLGFLGIQIADATICKPFSKFKIDCNTCFCSKEGERYACTRKSCRGQPDEFQFLNDEGFEDNDYTLPKEPVNDDMRPYINDEIPASKEDDWEDLLDNIDPDFVLNGGRKDSDDDNRYDEPLKNEDGDFQDIDGIDDYPIPYKYRRNM